MLAEKRRSEDPKQPGLIVAFMNFSLRHRVCNALKDQVYLRQTALRQTTDVLLEWERDTDRLRLISGGASWLHLPRQMEHITDKIRNSRHIPQESIEQLNQLTRQLRQGKTTAEAEFQLWIQGQPRWCRIRLSAAEQRSIDDGKDAVPARVLCVLRDIDQKKRRALRLQERAERDFLTGLYNKGTFQRQMEEACFWIKRPASGTRWSFWMSMTSNRSTIGSAITAAICFCRISSKLCTG